MSVTPYLAARYLVPQQENKEQLINETFNRVIAGLRAVVLDRDLTAPPVSPAEGDTYIVAAGASGDWSGRDGQLAVYHGGWLFFPIWQGLVIYVVDEDSLLIRRNGGFSAFGIDHTIDIFRPGQPASSSLIGLHVVSRAFTLPAGLTGSRGYANTPGADGNVGLDLRKNGSGIGSIVFAQGANTATFSLNADVTFQSGDRLSIVAPVTPDSAFADVSINLLANIT